MEGGNQTPGGGPDTTRGTPLRLQAGEATGARGTGHHWKSRVKSHGLLRAASGLRDTGMRDPRAASLSAAQGPASNAPGEGGAGPRSGLLSRCNKGRNPSLCQGRGPLNRIHDPGSPGTTKEEYLAGFQYFTLCYGPSRPPCFTEARVAGLPCTLNYRENKSDYHHRERQKVEPVEFSRYFLCTRSI
jgi:hypothetical protein